MLVSYFTLKFDFTWVLLWGQITRVYFNAGIKPKFFYSAVNAVKVATIIYCLFLRVAMPRSELMSVEIKQLIHCLLSEYRWQLSCDTQYKLAELLIKTKSHDLNELSSNEWIQQLEKLFLDNFNGAVSSFAFPHFLEDLEIALADKETLRHSRDLCGSLYCEKFGLMIPFAQSIQNRKQHLPELYADVLVFADGHCLEPDLAKVMAYALVCFARCNNKHFKVKQQLDTIYKQFYSGQQLTDEKKRQHNKNFSFFCNDLLGQLSLYYGRYGFLPKSSGVPSYSRMTLAAVNRKRTLGEGALFCRKVADKLYASSGGQAAQGNPNQALVKRGKLKMSR
jgi:hypothetical protein